MADRRGELQRVGRRAEQVSGCAIAYLAACWSTLSIRFRTPEASTISTIAVTTAEVAAWPTAAALRPHYMPRRQPEVATSAP